MTDQVVALLWSSMPCDLLALPKVTKKNWSESVKGFPGRERKQHQKNHVQIGNIRKSSEKKLSVTGKLAVPGRQHGETMKCPVETRGEQRLKEVEQWLRNSYQNKLLVASNSMAIAQPAPQDAILARLTQLIQHQKTTQSTIAPYQRDSNCEQGKRQTQRENLIDTSKGKSKTSCPLEEKPFKIPTVRLLPLEGPPEGKSFIDSESRSLQVRSLGGSHVINARSSSVICSSDVPSLTQRFIGITFWMMIFTTLIILFMKKYPNFC